MRGFFLFTILLIACASPPDVRPIPGQDAFAPAGWAVFRSDAPPSIEWVRTLNCDDGRGFIDESGECRGGNWEEGRPWIRVALPAGGLPDWTDLCHEFQHEADARAGIAWRGIHESPTFDADDIRSGPAIRRCVAAIQAVMP